MPLALIWLENRNYKIIKGLGVIIWCYLLGFILNLANIGFDQKTAETVAFLSFPLSLPLLLFEVNFSSWIKLARPAVKGFIIAIIASVTTFVLLPLLFFRDIPSVSKYAAMMSGMTTGGSVNFTALGVALEITPNAYIGLYTSEALIGAIYLLLVFKFARPILSRYFPKYVNNGEAINHDHTLKKINIKKALISIGASLLIVAISLGVSYLIFKKIHTTSLIFLITTLSLFIGPKTKLHQYKEAYKIGEYLLFVFCLSLGLMLDLGQLAKIGSDLFLFVCISYSCVIIIHFTLCKLIKLDGDTTLITNIAGIYGPPFILPMARVLNNDAIVMSGLTTSLVGQALGTYIGYLVFTVLNYFL